ncbi:MAG: patatin-like phospholipase family protein [Phycisphaerales bacterium]|nr:patatin-like phospholipase family protein [Phycisphaerales bacterium]
MGDCAGMRAGMLGCAALCAAVLAGCAVDRPVLTPGELELRRDVRLNDIQRHRLISRDRVVRRMALEQEEFAAGRAGPPVLDVLVLSGGGDYGAFGAGFLEGWGKIEDPVKRRPDFDVVTGVSTGALIAPFAFLGDETSYEQVVDLYSNPKKDWVTLRDLFFFLPGRQSFLSVDGLERDIKKQFGMDVIRRLAEEEAKARTLAIGTTDLDLGIMHPWDLTTEAKKVAVTENPARFYKVLMASAAIPAAFPPVVIDDTLYVDGGTTSNILYGSDLRAEDAPLSHYRAVHPGRELPKFRIWVIINNQLGGEPQVVQPTWLSITAASVSTAIRSSTIGTLKQLYLQTELQKRDGYDVEFRYVSIPDDWRPPRPGIFQKETMESLCKLGERLGRRTDCWRSDLVSQPSFPGEEGEPELLSEDSAFEGSRPGAGEETRSRR